MRMQGALRATEPAEPPTTPCIVLVGVASDIADWCARSLPGLEIVRIRHAPAACDPIRARQPLVVVLGPDVPPDGSIGDAARDTCAELIQLHESLGRSFLEMVLSDSVERVERRRARESAQLRKTAPYDATEPDADDGTTPRTAA
jgi:hypothetical protein